MRVLARCWRVWALVLASWWVPVTGALAFEPLAFSVVGPDGGATLRWVGQAEACPQVQWDDRPLQTMSLRVAPARTAAVEGVSRAVDFPVRVCEIAWPQGVGLAQVGAQQLSAPRAAAAVRRVVILADTGCRMKASENAFQDCNDPQAWPLAQIADAAARMKPDLVLHIGDIHYRESPCPAGREGCAGSPWGYGWSAWHADFFEPARRLLQTAPWLLVRGNHESCSRAGQGWFRLVDAGAWSDQRSCDAMARDALADHSTPFAVPVGGGAQFVVFDSSRAVNKALAGSDAMHRRYTQDMRKAEALARQGPSVFLSHHPLLAVLPAKTGQAPRAGGNASLLSVAQTGWGERIFPDQIDWAMHGHIHVFESLSFRGDLPASLVLGNSGSAMDASPPPNLPADFQVVPGAKLEMEAYVGHARFGFSVLDIAQRPGEPWALTQYDVSGQPMLTCRLTPKHSLCQSVQSH
jgi:Calcineurin-like phosphoesterase